MRAILKRLFHREHQPSETRRIMVMYPDKVIEILANVRTLEVQHAEAQH